MQKVVTIGGGTGHYQILRGLKNYECNITAIVNMSDDGGSTGILRDEYGVLPAGDIRQCLLALADEADSEALRFLFAYRFNKEAKHNLGNLILTALSERYGSVQGIKEAEKILHIYGKVLPVTIDDITLCAETTDGQIIRGESNVSSPENKSIRISRIFSEPEAFVYHESAEAIRKADKIIICPGDLYGSILPNFIVRGTRESLSESKAKKIYVCNLFTKEGSYNFSSSDFVREIEKYSGIILDYIVINSAIPSEETQKKYLFENSKFVVDDFEGDDSRIIRGDFVREYPSERKTLFRHVPEKIARAIISI